METTPEVAVMLVTRSDEMFEVVDERLFTVPAIMEALSTARFAMVEVVDDRLETIAEDAVMD